jgi:hypothetical protein
MNKLVVELLCTGTPQSINISLYSSRLRLGKVTSLCMPLGGI